MEIGFLVGFSGASLPPLLRAYAQEWIRHHEEGKPVLLSSDPQWTSNAAFEVMPPEAFAVGGNGLLLVGREARSVWRPEEIAGRDWLVIGDREEILAWWPESAKALPEMAMGFCKIRV